MPTLKVVEPTYWGYPDLGCRVHKKCLECPEERCLLEVPGRAEECGPVWGGKGRRGRDQRIAAHRALLMGPLPAVVVAERTGIEERTVRRYREVLRGQSRPAVVKSG